MKIGKFYIREERGGEWWVYDSTGIVVATLKSLNDAVSFAQDNS
jgi:hypothetical protein